MSLSYDRRKKLRKRVVREATAEGRRPPPAPGKRSDRIRLAFAEFRRRQRISIERPAP
jgi:hypothetical protein